MSPIPMSNEKDANAQEQDTVSPEVMKAIYGNVEDKKKAYEESLKRYARL